MQKPHLDYETEIWHTNALAAGVDEVGRGCLAGPVVAAAVVFDSHHQPNEKIRDSKKMTPKGRAEMFEFILDNCVDFGVGLVPAADIDTDGIVPATERAMRDSLAMLGDVPDHVLVDALIISDLDIPQKAIIKGDAQVYSIAAASIVAKVFRDSIVAGLDNVYPEYGFGGHKGYGVPAHLAAIQDYGFTPEHRRSFCRRISGTNT